jgi:hypothetical protein
VQGPEPLDVPLGLLGGGLCLLDRRERALARLADHHVPRAHAVAHAHRDVEDLVTGPGADRGTADAAEDAGELAAHDQLPFPDRGHLHRDADARADLVHLGRFRRAAAGLHDPERDERHHGEGDGAPHDALHHG